MVDVVMPQMGESIVEGTLTKWVKKPGERVERDEPLFEISTDKVDTEIPAPVSGTLAEVLVEAGATVAINTVVARIDDGAGAAAPSEPKAAEAPKQEAAAAAAPPPPAPKQEAPAASTHQAAGAGPYPSEPAGAPAPGETEEGAGEDPSGPLSPLVRRMAREYNIDLRQVKGTGAGGRITKNDVESFMSAQGAKTVAAAHAEAAPQQPAAPTPQPAAPQPVAAAGQPVAPLPPPGTAKTRMEPMSTMRQKIAEHMVFSVKTSPHVTTVHKVDITKVAKLREKFKGEFQSKYGYSLTFLPFITRAAVAGLQAFPLLNASIEGSNIIYHNEINIGIAVALDTSGLIVPVIRNADEKNIVGLQRSIVDLAGRARSRQLKPDEIQGGTFTITNYGSGGSIIGTPIINQPQVAILGVGAVEKQPVVVDDAIAIRSICYLSLSFDHRLIDGSLADAYVSKVKDVLQNFSEQVL